MMKKDKAQTMQQKVALAAGLRAADMTWAEIAPHVGRASGSSAASIKSKNRELWEQEYEKATIKLTAVCEASGIKTLTGLLLSESEQVRCAAAKALLAHADKFKAQKVHVTGEMKHTITTTELIQSAARSGFRRTNLIHELMNGAEN